MSKKTRKVICVEGDGTKAYEQIIFVMKDKKVDYHLNSAGKIDFVLEAEKIIEDQLNRGNKMINKAQKNAVIEKQDGIQQIVIKKGSSVGSLVNLFVIASCIMAVCTLVFMMN